MRDIILFVMGIIHLTFIVLSLSGEDKSLSDEDNWNE